MTENHGDSSDLPTTPESPGQPVPPVSSEWSAVPIPPISFDPPAAAPAGSEILPPSDILSDGSVGRPRRSRLAMTLSVVGVAVVVVAAGGVAFAYHKLAATGAQPDTLAPASSIAFAELDLDPSASEKVSAYQFEQKFPSLPHVVNADALKDTLLSSAFTDSGSSDGTKIDYATQIKPWLGNRVAIDEFLDSAGQPQTVGILQTKDATKAGAALAKLTSAQGGAYVIKGSYAIIGKSKAVVDDAAAQAAKSTIDNNTTYTKDIATLQSNRVLTVWWDAGATVKALSGKITQMLGAESQAFGALGALGASPAGSSALGSSISALGKVGRVVIGLRLTASAAELEGRNLGSSQPYALPMGKAVSLLGALPSSTIGGFSFANPSVAVKEALTAVKANSTYGPQLQKDFDAVSSELGIAIPADIENLLGSALSAGIDGIPASGSNATPPFTIITTPTDPAAGLATAQKLVALASKSGVSMRTTTTGGNVVISSGASTGSGTLGNSPAFQSMFSSMPTTASLAGYVNLTAIWAAEPSAPAAVRHLTGVGFVDGKDSTSPLFDLKLTVG